MGGGDSFYSGKNWAQKEASSDLKTQVLRHSRDASIIEFPYDVYWVSFWSTGY